MKIHCLYDSLVPVGELKPHPKNRNSHPDEQIKRLAQILEYQGFRYPIKVSKASGYITSGHGRLMAAKKLGMKEVPVNFQEYESEEQEYADIVADNSIASWSELDFSGINADIGDLGPDFDIDLLGIKNFEIEVADKEGLTDADAIPEHVEPKTKRGDIYRLGNHRLMCGDSTMIDDVEKLMDGKRAEMAFTDPPYGVDYDGGHFHSGDVNIVRKREKLKNDHSADIYTDVMPVLAHVVDGPIYTWYAASHERQLYNAIHDLDADYHAMIVWVKDGGYGALNAAYKQKHEPCVFWKPKGSTLRWDGPTTENTIWEMRKDKLNKLHPTQKPVELAERAIRNHKAESVLDLFGGSGSTLIACEKTNRKAFLMELDPHYCDVIIARFEAFSGQKAELLNG